MKRSLAVAATLFAVLISSLPAQARHHHYKYHYRHQQFAPADTFYRVTEAVESIVSHPSGCPRIAFCGCGASIEVFGRPIRELYLAANWFKFPHTSPAPGMVAVRTHHVFVIRSVNSDGSVVAYDANSGHHQTRIHTVSLQGYSVRDPHGAASYRVSYAMTMPVSDRFGAGL